MKKLLGTLCDTLSQGSDAMFLTVVAASGSSPRSAGAQMAIFKNGDTLGTIGGGAVELLASQQAVEALEQQRSMLRDFCLRPNEIEDIGMICGGDITVSFQFMDHRDSALQALLAHALALVTQGRENAWLVIWTDPQPHIGLYSESSGLEGLPKSLLTDIQPVLGSHAVCRRMNGALCYGEPLVRRGRVYIFGGGHVGQALTPLLAGLDFRVVVFDSRKEMADPCRFPQAEAVVWGDYRQIAPQVNLTQEDYVVIMTPGHQADFEVLAQALRSPARYVGCIGSRRKVSETKRRLIAEGLGEKEAARMVSPIGLDIGAETPLEIAVSVAAQLIAVRQGALGDSLFEKAADATFSTP